MFHPEDNGSGGYRIASRHCDGRLREVGRNEYSHARNAQIACDRLNGLEGGSDWRRFYGVREWAA